MTTPGSRVYYIGQLTLDLGTGRLVGPDGDIDIRPKALALLSHLAQAAGKVVSKDDLMQAIWPNVTVTEDSLSQCAHDLRRVMGADQSALRTIPRRGYMLDIPPGQDAAPSAMPVEVPQDTIAVLPFVLPPGSGQDDRILFDGIAHDVISGLAALRSFQVTGRGSSFAFRDLHHDPFRLRQLLRVSYVVTGRVLPDISGGRLVIDLLRTDRGSIVWSGEIALRGRSPADAAPDIAARCVAAIDNAVTLSERQRALAVRNRPVAAWEALHRGMDQIFHFDAQSMALALRYFTEATDIDPGLARAYAYQSFCHYFFAFAELSPDRGISARAAIDTASRALDADDNSPTAHWAYGRALNLRGDPTGARRHCQKAVEICPSFPNAHYMLGFIEMNTGNPEKALIHLDRSETLSPFDPFNASIQLTRALSHLQLGHVAQAADYAARTTRQRNVYAMMLFPAAAILIMDGRSEEALDAAGRIRDYDENFSPEKFYRSLYGLPEHLTTAFRKAQAELGL